METVFMEIRSLTLLTNKDETTKANKDDKHANHKNSSTTVGASCAEPHVRGCATRPAQSSTLAILGRRLALPTIPTSGIISTSDTAKPWS
jgi:hypothetical protein